MALRVLVYFQAGAKKKGVDGRGLAQRSCTISLSSRRFWEYIRISLLPISIVQCTHMLPLRFKWILVLCQLERTSPPGELFETRT